MLTITGLLLAYFADVQSIIAAAESFFVLCYRCGSYMPDGSRQCEACGEAMRNPGTGATPAALGSKVSGLRLPFADGTVLGGRYRLGEALGVGVAGWVVRAYDAQTRQTLALKILAANLLQTERERQTFVRALRAYRAAPDPNCVAVLDEGREKQYVFYAMPELSGMSLRKLMDDRMRHQRWFQWPELVPLLQQLVSALQSLAALKAHGALRPHNVVLSPDRLVVTGAPHWHGLPRRPFVVGQSAFAAQYYLAPEARSAHGEVNARADVYSLAVLLTEMMTGCVVGRDAQVWRVAKTHLPAALAAALRRNAAEPLQARAISPAHFLEELVAVMEPTQPAGATRPTPLSWQQAQTVLIPRLPTVSTPAPTPTPRLAHTLATGVLVLGFLVSLLLWLHESGLLRVPGLTRPAAPPTLQEDADGGDEARP